MLEGIIALVLAIGAAWFFGGKYAKKQHQAEQLKRNTEAHERAKEVKDEVGSLSGSDVNDRLRKRSGK